MKITVAVIDDQDIIRVGVHQLLSDAPHIALVGGFGDVDAFLHESGDPLPDIVILGDTLPGTSLSQAAQRILDACQDTGIIVLGNQLTAHNMHALLVKGVAGFVCKHEPLRDTLLVGIRRVHDGKVHFSPEAAVISQQYEPVVTLTPRLTEVLLLIAQGFHIQEIARELRISRRAAYAARARLRDALGVQTDAQLGAEAWRRGLLNYDRGRDNGLQP